MGLRWTVIALCALQALTTLPITEQSSEISAEDENVKFLVQDTSHFLRKTDDSLKGKVSALQETLEGIAECWGRRPIRRRRRPPTRPPPTDDDSDSDSDSGDSKRRRREALPLQSYEATAEGGQTHFYGPGSMDARTPASGQGSVSFSGALIQGLSAGMNAVKQTVGSVPGMMGGGGHWKMRSKREGGDALRNLDGGMIMASRPNMGNSGSAQDGTDMRRPPGGASAVKSSSMSSDGRGSYQSGGRSTGKAPVVNTEQKRRVKRQVDITGTVTAVGLAAQATLAVATQTLGLAREGISVGALAANTAIDVAQRITPSPKPVVIVRVYPRG